MPISELVISPASQPTAYTEPVVASRRAALLDVIARAAAPRERAMSSCFAPRRCADADSVVREREAEWVRLVSSGDRDAFLDLLGARGLELDDARRGLADAEVVDPESLPQWARDVLCLFSEEHDASADTVDVFAVGELTDAHALKLLETDPAMPWSMHRIFEPFVRRGRDWLRSLRRSSYVPIGPDAERQLLASLAQRMSAPCTTLLFHAPSGDQSGADASAAPARTIEMLHFSGEAPVLDQWTSLLREYPVTARLVAVAYRNWTSTVAELLGRVNDDFPALQATFSNGELGMLSECSLGMGDSHDHGRTVAVLTFASGTKVVYKPKDLGVARAYMRLIEHLNAAGLEPPLPTRRILPREHYGWEEFVYERECADPAAVRRFYRQLGRHARLVQFLDGVDFTGDNVIAVGDHPELVDLEALLAPRIPVGGDSPATDDALARAYESPVRGCLVTAKILGERGRQAAELGALAPPRPCILPFQQRAVRRTANGLALVDTYPEFPAFRATPRLEGRRLSSTDYFEDVAEGFVEMGALLRRCNAALLGDAGPLADLRRARVRCICRNTHVYARMLQASFAPARLRDGVARELCLERMWHARFTNPAVVTAEVDSLRALDIPMFASAADSCALWYEEQVLVDDFFDGTAAERLAARAAALADGSDQHDRELIESVLFTLAPAVRRPVAPPRTAPLSGTPDWLGVAARVGEQIVEAATITPGEPKWIGGNCHAWSGCWVFSVVADDLYSGAAGIALVLAELSRATGLRRFGEVAGGTLAGVSRRLKRAYAQMLVDPAAQPPGAMFGWSGKLYACDIGARLLDDDSLRLTAGMFVRDLALAGEERLLDLLRRTHAWDVGTGVTGLRLVMQAVECGTAAERTLIASAATRVLRESAPREREQHPSYPPGRWPHGVIRGATEVSDAVAAAATGGTTAADLLFRLSRARTDPEARNDSLAAADAFLGRPVRASDGLGWLDRGETALAAHWLSPNAGYLAVARDAGARLIGIAERTGRWFPECYLADRYNLSAFVGLSAVAHFFLCLAADRRFRSYRTLE